MNRFTRYVNRFARRRGLRGLLLRGSEPEGLQRPEFDAIGGADEVEIRLKLLSQRAAAPFVFLISHGLFLDVREREAYRPDRFGDKAHRETGGREIEGSLRI